MPEPIDIILPCYNPNDKWALELERFYFAAGQNHTFRFVVVDDGSQKGNVEEQARYLEQKGVPLTLISYRRNRGKGFALRKGVSASTSPLLIYTDIDLPFTSKSMLEMADKLVSGDFDVVAGFRDEKYYLNKMSSFRRLLSKSFRFFLRTFLHLPFTDTQCGLKGFNSRGKRKFLETTIDRYLFDFEFIYNSCRDPSLRVGTVPATLKEDIVFSRMPGKVLLRETLNLAQILLRPKKF